MTLALAIVENGHRGAVETQFADVFYLVRELNRQLGQLDVLLRGAAVVCALRPPEAHGGGDGPGAGPTPASRLALGSGVIPLPDVAASVEDLLDDGMAVAVDREDLAAIAVPAGRLISGVAVTHGDPARWLDYDGVWFL